MVTELRVPNARADRIAVGARGRTLRFSALMRFAKSAADRGGRDRLVTVKAGELIDMGLAIVALMDDPHSRPCTYADWIDGRGWIECELIGVHDWHRNESQVHEWYNPVAN